MKLQIQQAVQTLICIHLSFPFALLANETTCEKDDCCLYSESLNNNPNSATAAEKRKLSDVLAS